MARQLGVSRSAVTQACRPGGRLHLACSGTAVNALHEAARRWLSERQAATQELPPIKVDGGSERPSSRPIAELEFELGPRQRTDLATLAEPLTALTNAYGDAVGLERWVKCRKTLEEARKAELLRLRIEGRLVARTTVTRMIGHVDLGFRLLLSDAPRSIATHLAPENMAAATTLVRDVMSQILSAARDHMAASLEADDTLAPLLEAAE
jgi:hypothetical protein